MSWKTSTLPGKPILYHPFWRRYCFQQRIEWVGLLEKHPDLYQKAMQYEKESTEGSEGFTWASRESLKELMQPERVAQIRAEHARREQWKSKHQANLTLTQVFGPDESDDAEGCLICHL